MTELHTPHPPEEAHNGIHTQRYSTATVAWKKFSPPQPSRADSAFFFLPGWTNTPDTRHIAPICEALATAATEDVYSVTSRAHRTTANLFADEAQGFTDFIQSTHAREITLVGQSQNAIVMPRVARNIQEKNPDVVVRGLVFLSTMGLYEKTIKEHMKNLVEHYATQAEGSRSLHEKKSPLKLARDVARGVTNALGSNPHRIWHEVKGVTQHMPFAESVTVPVVLIHGAHDQISKPTKIFLDADSPEVRKTTVHAIFPNSPRVHVVMGKKEGSHYLPTNRPRQVARAAVHLLRRS